MPNEGWKSGNLLLDKITNPSAEKEDRLSQSKTNNSSCRNHAEKRLIVSQVDEAICFEVFNLETYSNKHHPSNKPCKVNKT